MPLRAAAASCLSHARQFRDAPRPQALQPPTRCRRHPQGSGSHHQTHLPLNPPLSSCVLRFHSLPYPRIVSCPLASSSLAVILFAFFCSLPFCPFLSLICLKHLFSTYPTRVSLSSDSPHFPSLFPSPLHAHPSPPLHNSHVHPIPSPARIPHSALSFLRTLRSRNDASSPLSNFASSRLSTLLLLFSSLPCSPKSLPSSSCPPSVRFATLASQGASMAALREGARASALLVGDTHPMLSRFGTGRQVRDHLELLMV